MNINIFKRGSTTLTSGVETWLVAWKAQTGGYSWDIKDRVQAFTDQQEAYSFAESVRRAHKLIGNSGSWTEVSVRKQKKTGLYDE